MLKIIILLIDNYVRMQSSSLSDRLNDKKQKYAYFILQIKRMIDKHRKN